MNILEHITYSCGLQVRFHPFRVVLMRHVDFYICTCIYFTFVGAMYMYVLHLYVYIFYIVSAMYICATFVCVYVYIVSAVYIVYSCMCI